MSHLYIFTYSVKSSFKSSQEMGLPSLHLKAILQSKIFFAVKAFSVTLNLKFPLLKFCPTQEPHNLFCEWRHLIRPHCDRCGAVSRISMSYTPSFKQPVGGTPAMCPLFKGRPCSLNASKTEPPGSSNPLSHCELCLASPTERVSEPETFCSLQGSAHLSMYLWWLQAALSKQRKVY